MRKNVCFAYHCEVLWQHHGIIACVLYYHIGTWNCHEHGAEWRLQSGRWCFHVVLARICSNSRLCQAGRCSYWSYRAGRFSYSFCQVISDAIGLHVDVSQQERNILRRSQWGCPKLPWNGNMRYCEWYKPGGDMYDLITDGLICEVGSIWITVAENNEGNLIEAAMVRHSIRGTIKQSSMQFTTERYQHKKMVYYIAVWFNYVISFSFSLRGVFWLNLGYSFNP